MITKQIFVAAGIIRYEDKILIAQRKKDCKLAPNKWEFPGGKIEFGENPSDTLSREINEELNLQITVEKLFDVASHVYKDDEKAINVVMIVYIAKSNSDEFELIEVQDAKWVEINKIEKYDFAAADIPIIDKIKKNGI